MSFQQGLSGLNAAARQLDVIGNNVANASTVGFKTSQTIFADVYANSMAASSATSVGIGTAVAAVQANFSQGNITATSNPLDIAINGSGFYRLDNNGAINYSRNGQFHMDKDGFVVNAQGEKLTGYGVDAAGALIASNPGPIQVSSADLLPTATSKATVNVNLDSREAAITVPFSLTDPHSYNKSTSMTSYDSLGNPHTLTSYFVKSAANTWTVWGSMDGAAATNLGTLHFKTDGTLDTTATTLPFNVSAAVTTGATTPLAFTLDFTGSTQFGSAFGTTALTQDGYTSGKIAGFSVSDDGVIQGRYSNGQSRNLAAVVLANFANPQGLQPLGGNAFAESTGSGQPLVGRPGSGSLGALSSGAVEDSNVDLTHELVDMITAQRIYQANAQTIKTQDQVLSTLVNLR